MTDISFYSIVVPILGLAPFFALAIICLILKFGQLCPGQHSRIQGELITIWTVLFVSIMMAVETTLATPVLVIGALGGVYGMLLSIWQGKLPNKRAIPDKAIYWSLLPIGIYALGVLVNQGNVFVVLPMIVTGAVLAQLLLVKAKHRLESFNRLLPMLGVVVSVIGLGFLGFLLMTLPDPSMIDTVSSQLLWFFGFLLVGLALWLLPLFSGDAQSYTLLGVATFLILISQILMYEVVVMIE